MPPDIKIPNNAEIDKALKEFEMKASGGQVPPVPPAPKAPEVPKASETPNNSEISQALKQFEVESSVSPQPQVGQIPKAYDEAPKMVRLVMKLSGGAIKEQKQAEYVLLGLVVVMFALSFYFFFGGSGNKSQKLTPAQLEQMRNIMPVNQ